MENLKKNPLSLQLNVEDFAPASNDEKKSLVVMRESVNFWKDGMRRLKKNKLAMVSLVVILLIAFMAYVLPSLGSLATDAVKGMNTYPVLLIAPALMISVMILVFNLFGDGLRDAFDPKLKS